jgi:hypothetical protein
MQFLRTELTRGYQLEHDEERFSARREKVYSFIKIPREVERFMSYGFLQVRIAQITVAIAMTWRTSLSERTVPSYDRVVSPSVV